LIGCLHLISLGSLVIVSVLLLLLRLVDFFLYRWILPVWPIMVDVDSGIFFDLFDTISLDELSCTTKDLVVFEEYASLIVEAETDQHLPVD
jgi:hypothetical protein